MTRQNEIVKVPMKIWLLVLSSLLFCAACATHTQRLSCEGTDWYELGRQQGRVGTPQVDKANLQNACSVSEGYEAHLQVLDSGYRSGLFEYCGPSNGFNLGRLNLANPAAICPAELRSAFNLHYQRGQRYRVIEGERRSVEGRIAHIAQDLTQTGISLPRRALLEGQKIELQEKRLDLEKALSANSEPRTVPGPQVKNI